MKQLSRADLDLVEQVFAVKARTSFWAFRRYMNPRMKVGWWQREVTAKLERFHRRLVAGERPMEVIEAPPQHGKSLMIVEFIAWALGKNPDLKTIYASFSDRLGVRANLHLQRMFDSAKYKRVFPGARIPPFGSHSIAKQRNREQIEFLDAEGGFRNTTVRGSITGEGLGLGVIDDPLKGRLEANSPTTRDGTWSWFTDDFFTRFTDDAGLLFILTRWHVDDPVGRLKEMTPSVKIHKYPAIATEDEKHRKRGDPLFPEHKSLEFLLERKRVLAETSWESLYQQSPFIASGGMFPIAKFEVIDYIDRKGIIRSVRYWDKAGTKDGDGAETAGTLMHQMRDGTFIIEDVQHGRWAALERETNIKHCATVDGRGVGVFIEQEPGSGGKESAEATIRNLVGFTIAADRPTGDKQTRAEPYAAQVQGANVKIMRGAWNRAFLEQHQQFPNGKLKDMVDASSGAFNKLAGALYDMEALT